VMSVCKMLSRDRLTIRPLKFFIIFVSMGFLFSGSSATVIEAKEKEPRMKSIRGHVTDDQKNPIVGAKIFIKNVNKNTTTILVTDEKGLYSIFGLDPKADYEVHAEHGKFTSELKAVSSYLNRYDNVFNFELGGNTGHPIERNNSDALVRGIELVTSDRAKVSGDWYQPAAKAAAKFPAVLLIHGFGEDRNVWQSFIKDYLLKNNFAVLNIDLRGHGASPMGDKSRLAADQNWIADLRQIALDLEGAVDWLRSQNGVDQNRIAVMGGNLGADMAFVASGKFDVIRSAVVLSGNPKNAQALAEGVENFQPHSILFMATQGDNQGVEFARQFEKLTGFPVRVQIYENSGAQGSKILQEIPEASALIVDWLKNTL
jgi:pimeloyl-ACP methyl ester carboxylesterase